MVEIKKMVHDLYDRLVIPELMVETVKPNVHVPNILSITELRIEEMEEERKKKEKE